MVAAVLRKMKRQLTRSGLPAPNMLERLERIRRALSKEVTTPGGRMNAFFGILMFSLIMSAYVSTWLDFAYAAFVTWTTHSAATPPGTPWWALLAFIFYAIFCLIYLERSGTQGA